MIVKLFTKKNCPKCPMAKKVFEEFKRKTSGKIRFEIFDAENIDGMAESAFYTVMSTPTILMCDDQGKEVKGWRGKVPSLKELNKGVI